MYTFDHVQNELASILKHKSNKFIFHRYDDEQQYSLHVTYKDTDESVFLIKFHQDKNSNQLGLSLICLTPNDIIVNSLIDVINAWKKYQFDMHMLEICNS